jgi:hypothetical protein
MLASTAKTMIHGKSTNNSYFRPSYGEAPSISGSSVSSASFGTQLSNPCVAKTEELERESTWTPLNMIRTLRGFNPEDNPEDGLEYAWTLDDGGTVTSAQDTKHFTPYKNGVVTMLASAVESVIHGMCTNNNFRPSYGAPSISGSRVSSASSGTELSNPYVAKAEELERESSWTPLNMLKTIREFNPEDGLDSAWTLALDGSADDGTVASEGDTVGSNGFSIRTRSSMSSGGWRNSAVRRAVVYQPPRAKFELVLSPTLESSPSKHMDPTPNTFEAQEPEVDEMRECDISCGHYEIEVRDISDDDLSGCKKSFPSGVNVAKLDVQPATLPMSTERTEMSNEDSSMQEQLDTHSQLSFLAVSLAKERKSPTAMKHLKRALGSLVVHLAIKPRKANSSSPKVVLKSCDDNSSLPVSSGQETMQSQRIVLSSSDLTNDFQTIDGDDNQDYMLSHSLAAVSTVTASNMKQSVARLDQAETFHKPEMVDQPDATVYDVDKNDICLKAVGLGCLVLDI